ncbi:MAG: hypothetical protein QM530_09245 [Phycisphaerales bacterium]|nr:hypothetical protein [Phycisphaerales bacterium]
MKKQTPLILAITNPCHENWAEMTPVGMGRFCRHCKKTVTDITKMTDEQVLGLFKQNADTHCIRAFAFQLNRPITLPTTQEPTRFYSIALALTLVLATGADAYARPRPPLLAYNYVLDTDDSTRKETIGTDTMKISGNVADESGNPFPGVIVILKSNGLNMAGTTTDDEDLFEISLTPKLKEEGTFDLKFSTPSYNTKVIVGLRSNQTDLGKIKVKMEQDNQRLIMGMFVTPPKPMEKTRH